MKSFPFPLGLQTAFPADYATDRSTCDNLATMQELGLTNIEINIADPASVERNALEEFLRRYALRFTYYASGLTAKTFGLSLSHPDSEVRARSVEKMKQIIDFLESSDVGIIIGFFKGPAGVETATARAGFRECLERLLPHAENRKVKLCVEATNRYESSVANSLADTVELLTGYLGPYCVILPDTFHMNIEESDMIGSFKNYLEYFDSIHVSDNNRFYPGHGAIDFSSILSSLRSMGFSGSMAIEGNIAVSFSEDLKKACNCLEN